MSRINRRSFAAGSAALAFVQAKVQAATVRNRALETAQYGWLGQWYGPGAARASLKGWLKAPVTVLWNIEKA